MRVVEIFYFFRHVVKLVHPSIIHIRLLYYTYKIYDITSFSWILVTACTMLNTKSGKGAHYKPRSGDVGHEINAKGWQCNDISSTIPKKKQLFISKYFVSLKMDWHFVLVTKTYKPSAATLDVSEWRQSYHNYKCLSEIRDCHNSLLVGHKSVTSQRICR